MRKKKNTKTYKNLQKWEEKIVIFLKNTKK